MSDVDLLVIGAVACPGDATRRGVLADKADELGDADVAACLRDDSAGPEALRWAWQVAGLAGRPPCYRLLWYAAVYQVPEVRRLAEGLRTARPGRLGVIGPPVPASWPADGALYDPPTRVWYSSSASPPTDAHG